MSMSLWRSEIDAKEMPSSHRSRRYSLQHEGKMYPPRYVLSIANKYVNGSTLDHAKIGSHDANAYFKALGFHILDLSNIGSDENRSYLPVKDKAPEVRNYLKKTYSIHTEKAKGFRSGLLLPSGSVIHVSGSKLHPETGGFYALTYNKYKDIETKMNTYYAIVLDSPDKTFVLPSSKVKEIFDGIDPGDDKEWHYRITEKLGHLS